MKHLPIYDFDPKYVADTDAFTFDMTAWLGDEDSLDSVPTATVTPSSASLESIVMNDGKVTAWISGGTNGTRYTIELHVHSTMGRDCRVRGRFCVET